MTLKHFSLAALFGLAGTLAFAAPASAQDHDVPVVAQSDDEEPDEDEDDFLEELLGETETVASEREAVESGDIDDRVGVQGEEIIELTEDQKKRLIKTLERKNFLKLGRWEATPTLGAVTNDPFLRRYLGGVGLAYHITEIFAVEGMVGFSPNLAPDEDTGEACNDPDWKPLTCQLVSENHVSPDISKLTLFYNGTFQFSPIYGKVALNGRRIINFDIFGSFGMGATHTQDDLNALGADQNDEKATNTANQIHPTTNFGGGARIILNESFALRVDGRSLVYIETVNSTTLEMKNNFILTGSLSIFFPGMD